MRGNELEDYLKRAAAVCGPWEELPTASLADELGLPAEKVTEVCTRLEQSGLMERREGRERLTEKGWTRGIRLLRAHRVYESFLAEQTGLEPKQWHREADRVEHDLDKAVVDRLAGELNHPRYDPHGDAIPTRDLELNPSERGELLVRIRKSGYYRITHLEDEPQEPFTRLIRAGLSPGIRIWAECLNGGRFLLQWADRSHRVDSGQASALTVVPCTAGEIGKLPQGSLAGLRDGDERVIHSLSPSIRGLQRRRLMDLGFVPGARVTRQATAALAGPAAFVVRGTTQALRKEQAEQIFTE